MVDLNTVDIRKGETFIGGPTLADEPLSKLLKVGNLGGFRPKKNTSGGMGYIVIFSTGEESEWPDGHDSTQGIYRYFGDNRVPGKDLLSSDGNKLVDRMARLDLSTIEGRRACSPFLLFRSAVGHPARSVVFEGVGVPGGRHWCVAKHFRSSGTFMNFEIELDVLADVVVPRLWLDELIDGSVDGPNCPAAYRHWLETGDSIVTKSHDY